MSDVVRGDDGVRRCRWGASTPDYALYHDTEWGRAVVDDTRLYEKLCLEGFQSGLSWESPREYVRVITTSSRPSLEFAS